MNNQHNAIALRIERLQDKWEKALEKQPGVKLVRWLIDPEEAVLLNGFFKLESSAHGSVPELFVVLLVPFENSDTFAGNLCREWLAMWEKERGLSMDDPWQSQTFREALDRQDDPADFLLIDLLSKFHQAYSQPESRTLVPGLMPGCIHDFSGYNKWLKQFVPKLPEGVCVTVVDHLNKNHLETACTALGDDALTITCGDLEIREAIEDVATSGNPAKPDVQFRTCLFEMGRGLASKNKSRVNEWGEKALQVGQKSRNKSLWATAHLVYAGFLMHFRGYKQRIHQLLDQGIQIAAPAFKAGDQESLPILLQLYGYKASYYSMRGDKSEAVTWMAKQADLAVEQQMVLFALSACHRTAYLAKKNNDRELRERYLNLGYKQAEFLSADELKASEIGVVARELYDLSVKNNQKEKAAGIDRYMSRIFGKDWHSLFAREKKGYTPLQTVQEEDLIT